MPPAPSVPVASPLVMPQLAFYAHNPFLAGHGPTSQFTSSLVCPPPKVTPPFSQSSTISIRLFILFPCQNYSQLQGLQISWSSMFSASVASHRILLPSTPLNVWQTDIAPLLLSTRGVNRSSSLLRTSPCRRTLGCCQDLVFLYFCSFWYVCCCLLCFGVCETGGVEALIPPELLQLHLSSISPAISTSS